MADGGIYPSPRPTRRGNRGNCLLAVCVNVAILDSRCLRAAERERRIGDPLHRRICLHLVCGSCRAGSRDVDGRRKSRFRALFFRPATTTTKALLSSDLSSVPSHDADHAEPYPSFAESTKNSKAIGRGPVLESPAATAVADRATKIKGTDPLTEDPFPYDRVRTKSRAMGSP